MWQPFAAGNSSKPHFAAERGDDFVPAVVEHPPAGQVDGRILMVEEQLRTPSELFRTVTTFGSTGPADRSMCVLIGELGWPVS
jgi:hypothetical protein